MAQAKFKRKQIVTITLQRHHTFLDGTKEAEGIVLRIEGEVAKLVSKKAWRWSDGGKPEQVLMFHANTGLACEEPFSDVFAKVEPRR